MARQKKTGNMKSSNGANLVDCMIALPGQLFYTTPIPVCLWFITRSKKGYPSHLMREGQTLFIDTRKMGHLIDRTHREFQMKR